MRVKVPPFLIVVVSDFTYVITFPLIYFFTGPGQDIEVAYFRWKLGLYLPLSMTMIGLLMVFVVLEFNWSRNAVERVRQRIEESGADATSNFNRWAILRGKISRAQIGKKNKPEAEAELRGLQDELKKMVGEVPLARELDSTWREATSFSLWRDSLRVSLFSLFVVAFIASWEIASATGASSTTQIITDPTQKVLLRITDGFFAGALLALAIFFLDFIRTMRKGVLDSVRENLTPIKRDETGQSTRRGPLNTQGEGMVRTDTVKGVNPPGNGQPTPKNGTHEASVEDD